MAAAQLNGSCALPLGAPAQEGQPFDKLRANGEEVSRRALLGAALGLPLLGSQPRHCEAHSDEAIQLPPPSGLPPPDQVRGRNDERRWHAALAAYRAAEAAVREEEGRTAGASMEEEAAREEVYGRLLDAMYGALRRAMRVPAPDVGAPSAGSGQASRKAVLMIDHEVATLSGGEACLAAVRRDAVRLCPG